MITHARYWHTDFSTPTCDGLIEIFSCFGFREIPTSQSLRSSAVRIALCEFVLKPSAAILVINHGISSEHRPFWEKLGAKGLYDLYRAKSVSTAKVLEMFAGVEGGDQDQERVLLYLRQFIGALSNRNRKFSVLCERNYSFFQCLTLLARRPIAHTCEPSLELSTTYSTYFVKEFRLCLPSNMEWQMNAL